MSTALPLPGPSIRKHTQGLGGSVAATSLCRSAYRSRPTRGTAISAHITVRLASRNDESAWDRYVDNHPDSTPFHVLGWARALADNFRYRAAHLLAERRGRICGVLPLLEVSSRITGRRLCSMPFSDYGGPIADSADTGRALVNHVIDLAEERGARHVELRFGATVSPPLGAEGLQERASHSHFRRTLPSAAAAVVASLPRDSRRLVRKGNASGLEARVYSPHLTAPSASASAKRELVLSQARALNARTMRDLGTPTYPARLLRQLVVDQPSRWLLWTVWDQEKMVAAAWTASHRRVLYPHFVGYDPRYRRLGVNTFLTAKLMEYGAAQRYTAFDIGRSKTESGAYHFKRRFGFDPEPARYRYHVAKGSELPRISPDNSRYRLAIGLWRKLPLRVATALDPRLVGHFG